MSVWSDSNLNHGELLNGGKRKKKRWFNIEKWFWLSNPWLGIQKGLKSLLRSRMTNELIELLRKTSCCFCKRNDQVKKKMSWDATRRGWWHTTVQIWDEELQSHLQQPSTHRSYLHHHAGKSAWMRANLLALFTCLPAASDCSTHPPAAPALCICLLPLSALLLTINADSCRTREQRRYLFMASWTLFSQSWEMNASFTSKSKSSFWAEITAARWLHALNHRLQGEKKKQKNKNKKTHRRRALKSIIINTLYPPTL